MEQFILNLFQEHLSKFIIGFRKEQVTTNLLSGKGEITAVELNCSYINEMLRNVTPYIEFESVHVSKVSFHVHSWTNIRQAPIIIDIEHIAVVILEPMQYDPDANRRTKVRQVTFQELIQLMKDGTISKPRSPSSSYSLLDRIFDNLVVEVRSISVTFQPMGIFKTRRIGPWTPPALLIQLSDIRWVNVNEYGDEESKNNISRQHRKHHHSRKKDGTLLVFKKLEMEYQISFVVTQPIDMTDSSSANSTTRKDVNLRNSDVSKNEFTCKTIIPIISSSLDVIASSGPRTFYHHPYKKMEMHWTIQRRIRDGEYLAVQMDCMIPMIDIVLADRATLSHLVHFATALQFCFCKDRSFADPLQPTGVSSLSSQKPFVVISTEQETLKSFSSEGVMSEKTESEELELSKLSDLNLADGLSDSSEDDDNTSADDDDVEVDSEQQDQKFIRTSKSGNILVEEPSVNLVSQSSDISSSPKSNQTAKRLLPNSTALSSDRPLLVFSNGLIIHEKFSLSFSLHQMVIRANHTNTPDDCIEITLKGFVTEVIWPPVTREKGWCLQVSVSHLSVHERFGNRMRFLLIAGQKQDGSGSLEQTHVPLQETNTGKVFPMFQDRSVRPDPLGMRQTYLSQAVGLKVLTMLTSRSEQERFDEWMIFPEIGFNQFDVFMDTNSWCRLFRFLLVTEDGGFDSQWWSGDYGRYISSDMLLHPSNEFIINDCLQPLKQDFLDESYFPSSDRLNAIIRITNVYLCVPGSTSNDIRSCDIHIRLDEIVVKTSSKLPRTLANTMQRSQIEFPHDPSDICFTLGDLDSIDAGFQKEISQVERITMFRSQANFRGLSITVSPMIPFRMSHEPRQLLLPTDISTMFCLEERPVSSERNESSTKLLLLSSFIVHRLETNIDFDSLAATLCTFLFHGAVCNEFTSCLSIKSETNLDDSNERVRNTFLNRKDLIQKRMNESWKNGVLIVLFNLSVVEASLRIWCQNVPRTPPLQPVRVSSIQFLPILKLFDLHLKDFTLSMEALHDMGCERVVGKLSSIEICLELCDFRQFLDSDTFWLSVHDTSIHALESPVAIPDMIQCSSFKANRDGSRALDVRVEYRRDKHCSLTFAVDICKFFVDNQVDVIENTIFLFLDSLLRPCCTPTSETFNIDSHSCIFAHGTVGYLFATIFSKLPSTFILSDNEHAFSDDFTASTFLKSKLGPNLLSMFTNFAASSLDVFLVRVGIGNVDFRVPNFSTDCGLFRVSIDSANAFMRYLGSEGLETASILDVFGHKQEKWSTICLHMNSGCCHGVKSMLSIVYTEPVHFLESGETLREECIVDGLGLDCSYNNSKLFVDVGDHIFIGNSSMLERFFGASLSLFRSWLDLSPKILERLKLVLANRGQDNEDSSGANTKSMNLACSSLMGSLSFLGELFGLLRQKALTLSEASKSAIHEKDKEIAELRMMVFLKEKERLGTFALFSSDATGWLRLGSAERSGIRGLMSCMLWPHWVVLRRSLLLFYASPGSHEIVDVVSLEGATLHEIAGGSRKRDLKRAFALVDNCGIVFFLIAGSESELTFWLESLQQAIQSYSFASAKNSYRPSPSFHSSQSASVVSSIDDATTPNRPLARSLAKVVNAAKVKGQAVVARGMNNSVQRIDSQVGDMEEVLNADEKEVVAMPAVQQIRNRFAVVGQATKNRLGSAIAAAKQKGKEAAQLRRQGAAGYEWPCVQCTFINSSNDLDCQMCSFVRPVGDQNDATRELTMQVPGSSLTEPYLADVTEPYITGDSDLSVEGRAESQIGIKNRFESVVRRARNATLDGSKLGRLNSRQNDQHQEFGASKAQRLSNVTLGGQISSPTKYLSRPHVPDLPLKQLRGTWIVQVDVLPEIPMEENSPKFLLTDNQPFIMDDIAHKEEHFERKENGVMTIPSHPNSDDLKQFVDLSFKIQASKHESGLRISECVDLKRTLSEVAAFYTSVSEIVTRAPSLAFNQGLNMKPEESLDVSIIECVITTGKMLAGLLELPCRVESIDEPLRSFYAVVVSDFLNNIVNSPLPIDGLACVAEFLQLSDSSSNNHTIARTSCIGVKPKQKFPPSTECSAVDANASEFYRILALCEAEHSNSKMQSAMAQRLMEISQLTSVSSPNLSAASSFNSCSNVLPPGQFQEGMVTALNRVMEERDSMHSNLVTAEVLHRFEMDEQRKLLARLSEKLQDDSNETKTNTTEAAKKNGSKVSLNRTDAHFHRDVDTELLSLCQQLAGEISARAAADMEVVRLKESRQIELELEAAEKKSLQMELKLAREQLQLQNERLEAALQDARIWRESFEEVSKFRKSG